MKITDEAGESIPTPRPSQDKSRDIWECANQLLGYIDPSTPKDLAEFLRREGLAAADLAKSFTACQQEVETLREGIKEIAERERGIRDNWARHEESTKARILELEADLEIANDKLRTLQSTVTQQGNPTVK